MRALPIHGLGVLGLALLALVPLSPPTATAEPTPGKAVVRTLDLERVEGTLVALDGEQVTLQDAGGAARRLALDGAIAMTLPAAPVRRGKGTYVRAWFTGGSRVVARIVGGAEDLLKLESPSLGRFDVLLDHVRTLEALPASDDPCLDLAKKHPRPDEGDIAYDADGDELRGSVLEVDDDGVSVETAGSRVRRVAWSALTVLHLENDPPKPATGLHAELDLQDGSRVRTHAAPRLDGDAVTYAFRSMPAASRRIALAQVRGMRWYGGRFVYASALPFEAKHALPYATPEEERLPLVEDRWFGARVDRGPDGCPLRMGGRTFRHGFGTRSKSTITIRLDGAYESYRAWFGIDDGVLRLQDGLRGNVDARVLGDGKVLWEAKDVEGEQKPRRVGPLDVKGVKVLVLEVGFGKPGPANNAGDRGNWGDPILVRAAK